MPSSVYAQLPYECGSLENAYGPFDYTNPRHFNEKLGIVEKGHFPKYVENLEHGKAGSLASDLDYVLRAFPNHHRALNSMSKYALKKNAKKTRYTIDCYFMRARYFAPSDGKVLVIQGIYEFKQKKWKEAIEAFEEAAQYMPENSEIYYNLGLTYIKLEKYDLAQKMADKAYGLGYPMSGLREALKKVRSSVD